jgi:hypothetical protein
VARGRGNARGGTLVPRPDLLDHPRVKYAASFKNDLDVFGFDDAARSAVVVLGRGVARLPELSIELEADRRGRGEGSALAAAALAQLPRGSLVVACVASCNAASVRSFLHAGFTSIGSFAVSAARRRLIPLAPKAPGPPALTQRAPAPKSADSSGR